MPASFYKRCQGMCPPPAVLWALLAIVAAVSIACADEPNASPASNAALAVARRLFQEGKYAEAEEAYEALAPTARPAAALGLARCQAATGRRDAALKTLSAAIEQTPADAALHAEIARISLDAGDLAAAATAADAALKLDEVQVLALWVRAEVLTAAGKLDEAGQVHLQLVRYYNRAAPKDPETLRWIGLAAAQYARWNRLSDQFSFLVNDFYPDLLAADPGNWQSALDAGRLYAEKYNEAEASQEFARALKLNPNAAEALVAVGCLALEGFDVGQAQAACDRALEINPQLLAARHLQADIHLANFDPRSCAGVMSEALKLNPISEASLGRLAAAYLATDGVSHTGPDTRFGKLAAEVELRNPRAGQFYECLSDALDRLRRWPAAAQYYELSRQRMPQAIGPSGKLGLMLMRLGDEPRAKQVLDEAFAIDPFNLRVKNTLEVLEVLAGYQTLETDHFRIRFDPAKDRILADSMGQWLEEVYPQLVRQFGFAPQDKSLFEVFCRARNTDGHGWFSARMVGLPNIHPIGACAGKIVALQSPSEGPQRFNWARVLKHEFVHIINLEQTEFNIPHWFTEGLATMNEGYDRPQSWNELLVSRAERGRLFNLQTINLGFIRPQSTDEWNLAYCQAELYAEYLLKQFGDDAIARMLAAYADNLTTPEALRRALGASEAEFEKGYRQYLDQVVAQMPRPASQKTVDLAKALAALERRPDDAELWAAAALGYLDGRDYPAARRAADEALVRQPNQALASYVRARLHLLVGEDREALARLEVAFDRQQPQANLLALLAGLKLKAEDFLAAAELYQLGADHDPVDTKWLKSLAAVYLRTSEDAKLASVLEKLAAADPDDLPVRKKLAQLALARQDYAATLRWTLESLHFYVLDAQVHAWRGEALAATADLAGAAREYALAIELDPQDSHSRLALAEVYLKRGDQALAKNALNELLKLEPDHPQATRLLEGLQ